MMITFEAKIKDKTVRMYSNAPLKNAATAVLRTLNKLSNEVDIFTPGFTMMFGWAAFMLTKRESGGNTYYVVQTFDYYNNPSKRIDDVSIALTVQNMQMDTNMRAGVNKPEPTTYKDKILVLKSAVDAKDVYLNRSDVTRDGDSGWYFGLLNDEKEGQHDPDELVSVCTYELLRFRGEAMRVLQMPVGTLAVFNGTEMTALVDKDDTALDFSTADERKQAIARRESAKSAMQAEEAAEKSDGKNTDGE